MLRETQFIKHKSFGGKSNHSFVESRSEIEQIMNHTEIKVNIENI